MCLQIVVTFVLFKTVLLQYSQCVNPRNLKGQCVPIQQCDYLLNVARLSQQNQEARLFLSRSQCGFNGHTPYVCCPQTNQATSQQNSNQQQNKNVIAEKLTNSFLPKPPECGVDLEDRVFGGTQTNIGEFPWFALLKYIRPGATTPIFSCGGSLINNRYVVTAAHCVHPTILQRTKLTAVRLGEWNLLTNPDCDDSFVNEQVCNNAFIDAGIEQIIVHEKFVPQSFNQLNDIALIRLSLKVAFTEFIKPICLQEEPTNISLVGQSVSVAGFGRTETAFSSNIKQKVSLDIVETEKCNQVFRATGRKLTNDLQICAGGKKNIDSCRGDSGGGLMKMVSKSQIPHWALLGIVSYGLNPCGQENKPAVYTKISAYLPWIESKLRA